MGRGSTQVLIRRIIESLAKSPKSSTEIAEQTGLDRTAISRYLDVLKESRFVVEEQIGTSKKYILSSQYRTDTYFGLPIDEETELLINSLYFTIEKKWNEKTRRKLLKTTAQKIMYDIISKCNLKIPHGWYIFGGVCVKPYDYNESYTQSSKLNKGIINCVNESVTEYSKNSFEYESRQLQYKKAKNDLYDTKEDILKLLYSKNFSENSMYIFQKLFGRFWRLAPKGDKLYNDLINDYEDLLIDITKYWDDFVNEKNERIFAEFKQKLISSFERLWKMVAMQNFKQDLLNKKFYMEKQLDEHFGFDLSQIKEELIEIGSELNDMIPFEESDNPVHQQIKEIRKNASKMPKRTRQEQKKVQDEMDEYEKKHGLEALGKKLRKDFGL